MKANNPTDRRKRIIAFAGLYAASIILLLFILSAFGMRFTGNDQPVANATVDFKTLANTELLRSDSLLHTELQELQQADIRYSLLADSGGAAQKNNAFMVQLDASAAIKKSIDSIERMAGGYTGDEGLKYATMLNTFRSVLNDRILLKKSQAVMAGDKSLSGSSLDMMQWRNEIQGKDNDIVRLQNELSMLRNKDLQPTKTSGAGEAQKGEIELLRTAFTDQQKEYEALKNKYNSLRTESNAMATQLVDVKRTVPVQPEKNSNAAADNKVAVLEQKLEALNADLYFAKIDCNLARTDAQQMISNARQRKELLSESLVMLNSLAKSDDAEIQKKAKDKIVRLNRIATVLHD